MAGSSRHRMSDRLSPTADSANLLGGERRKRIIYGAVSVVSISMDLWPGQSASAASQPASVPVAGSVLLMAHPRPRSVCSAIRVCRLPHRRVSWHGAGWSQPHKFQASCVSQQMYVLLRVHRRRQVAEARFQLALAVLLQPFEVSGNACSGDRRSRIDWRERYVEHQRCSYIRRAHPCRFSECNNGDVQIVCAVAKLVCKQHQQVAQRPAKSSWIRAWIGNTYQQQSIRNVKFAVRTNSSCD